MVGLEAALFVLISKYGFTDVPATGRVVPDPSRVAVQIVSGLATTHHGDGEGSVAVTIHLTGRGDIRKLVAAVTEPDGVLDVSSGDDSY